MHIVLGAIFITIGGIVGLSLAVRGVTYLINKKSPRS